MYELNLWAVSFGIQMNCAHRNRWVTWNGVWTLERGSFAAGLVSVALGSDDVGDGYRGNYRNVKR